MTTGPEITVRAVAIRALSGDRADHYLIYQIEQMFRGSGVSGTATRLVTVIVGGVVVLVFYFGFMRDKALCFRVGGVPAVARSCPVTALRMPAGDQ
ncbi:hypothetical protein [Frankia sp. CiP3]|uniref:hypothetical protein n=1 Tax=Frankia sp. CiP3 TaxID=2880971 RepID=UPI001EF4F672|nr:hypothetical protein [Frankia sp. CiP3]